MEWFLSIFIYINETEIPEGRALAGYQRFVAYVYEYRKGKKDGSSGYVRVEARDCLLYTSDAADE